MHMRAIFSNTTDPITWCPQNSHTHNIFEWKIIDALSTNAQGEIRRDCCFGQKYVDGKPYTWLSDGKSYSFSRRRCLVLCDRYGLHSFHSTADGNPSSRVFSTLSRWWRFLANDINRPRTSRDRTPTHIFIYTNETSHILFAVLLKANIYCVVGRGKGGWGVRYKTCCVRVLTGGRI